MSREWWQPDYGFFGDFYVEGDNSLEGYRQEKKESLDERVKSEVDGIINLLDLSDKARILDLPCGYGRHSIELARREFSVTGCDINERHLSFAIGKSKQHNFDVSFVTGNMLNFRATHKFDALVNMFYSFGFFEKEEENLETLRNFYENLAPGGKFLFHTDVNLERVASGKYREYEERTLVSGKKLKIIDKYDSLTGRMNGSWIINNGSDEVVKSYSVRVYTREEFFEMCAAVNFINMRVFGDWDGSAYTQDSEDMIIVADKPL